MRVGKLGSGHTDVRTRLRAFLRLALPLGALALALPAAGQSVAPAAETPEVRALRFLEREVPRWPSEHKCFSCHNNGDAVRALYLARRLSYAVSEECFVSTNRWLSNPLGWDDNKGDPRFSDKGLADIQFGAALAAAHDAAFNLPPGALAIAGRRIAAAQQADGSWQIDAAGTVGSPVTYGTALATLSARRVLARADSVSFRRAINRADDWFNRQKPQSTLDAATVLWSMTESRNPRSRTQIRAWLDLLLNNQTRDGGWGPYPKSPPEAFDTAIVLLALAAYPERDAVRTALERGRAFLVTTQMEDGSWQETTRPPGAESYAQRLSTTGWATQALLAVRH